MTAHETTPAPGTTRPGGRTARVREAVFDAALEEVALLGFDDISVESIAARAGVHKTTVYRRWGSKDQLLGEALKDAADSRIGLTDSAGSGDVADELRLVARAVLATVRSRAGAAAVRTLLSGGQSSAEVRTFIDGFFDERIAQVAPLVRRAVERGQLPPGTDPVVLFKQLVGPLYYRHFIMADPLTEADADLAAAAATAAAAAGTFVPRSAGG
ncbi:TetR/AcrR family transcriptional regulator [Streptacidiphilus sp. EB129]|jgi:AcrR family transcriptional regulator|uniref:TetR/AcrR family transcriptional regulator n=1 Tax=Streptacidiphilus sp. EB129 TaxID=3156262 RepID=UPI003517BF5E